MFINIPRHKLKQQLGLFGLCVVGVGGTVGGGIFVLLSPGAGMAGAYLPLSFLIGGVLALGGALLYAELGTMIPRSGSSIELVFSTTRKRYYPFVFSWLVLLGDVSYLVINALGLAFYANFFIAVNPLLIALGAIGIAALINLRGTAVTGKAEMITETTLVALLFAFAAFVFSDPQFNFAPGEFITHIPLNIIPALAGVAVVFTTYVGYEYIASIAEEAKDPAQNIPRALIISVIIAVIVFTVVSVVATGAVSSETLASTDAPLLLVAERIGGVATYLIIPAALLATGGSLLAATLVSSRRLYALSQQGYFRNLFSSVNRFKVPHRSVLGVATLAVLLLLTDSVAFIAYVGNTVYLIVMMVIAVSLLRLRRQRPYLARPFRAPLFPWLPLGMIGLAAAILAFVGPFALAITALWALLGYFVYLATKLSAATLQRAMWGAMVFLLLFSGLGILLLF